MGILSSPDPVSDNAALEEITKEHVFEQFMELHGQFRGNEDFNAMVVTNGPTADVTMVQGSFQDIKFRALASILVTSVSPEPSLILVNFITVLTPTVSAIVCDVTTSAILFSPKLCN